MIRAIVRANFYIDDEKVDKQEDLVKLFEEAVANDEVFFEVNNVGKKSPFIDLEQLIKENISLNQQLEALREDD